MIRCIQHTRRRSGGRCCICDLPYRVGEIYRELVAINEEWHDGSFYRRTVHNACLSTETQHEWFALTQAGKRLDVRATALGLWQRENRTKLSPLELRDAHRKRRRDDFAHHQLTHLVDHPHTQVYQMRRPGCGAYWTELIFVPGATIIRSDASLGANKHGVCSNPGHYGLPWFRNPQLSRSPSHLAEKFLRKRWHLEAAREDIALRALDPHEEDGRLWLTLLEDALDPDATADSIYRRGDSLFSDFWDYGVGTDYPADQLATLLAIQSRFAALLPTLTSPEPDHA